MSACGFLFLILNVLLLSLWWVHVSLVCDLSRIRFLENELSRITSKLRALGH